MLGLHGFNMVGDVRPLSYPHSHLCILSDTPSNFAMHITFLILFFVFMFALLRMEFSDPGICAPQTKDDNLKPVCEIFFFSPFPEILQMPWCYLISHIDY